MAELTPMDRLQPCLLDRLRDDEPGATQEGRERRVISPQRLREAVLRDLIWLLNANCETAEEHLEEFPEVQRSVVNFGMPDLCGVTSSAVDPKELERRLVEVIRAFEPRILPESLSIGASADRESMNHNAIFFEIRGELWAQPLPDQLYIKTEVDLETGRCELKDRPHG